MMNEKISNDDNKIVNEEPKCYSHFIFIVILIIICLCIILPLGITSNTYNHKKINFQISIYYPTSQTISLSTILRN
jgi:hypothetical protein